MCHLSDSISNFLSKSQLKRRLNQVNDRHCFCFSNESSGHFNSCRTKNESTTVYTNIIHSFHTIMAVTISTVPLTKNKQLEVKDVFPNITCMEVDKGLKNAGFCPWWPWPSNLSKRGTKHVFVWILCKSVQRFQRYFIHKQKSTDWQSQKPEPYAVHCMWQKFVYVCNRSLRGETLSASPKWSTGWVKNLCRLYFHNNFVNSLYQF